jgi:hypothetical protein
MVMGLLYNIVCYLSVVMMENVVRMEALIINSWSRAVLEKLMVTLLVEKLTAFYKNRKLNAVFSTFNLSCFNPFHTLAPSFLKDPSEHPLICV